MDIIYMKITEVMDRLDELVQDIYKNEVNSYEAFLEIYPYIKAYYEEFIELAPKLNEVGVDIKSERLLQEMRDMAEALEKRDNVLWFDTLNYRVKETLQLYRQIKEIMEEE